MIYKFDDIEVNYEVIGESGTSILFLHGWGGNIESFRTVASEMSTTNRCILLDFPPFGKSDEPYQVWDLDKYMQLVKCLIDRLKYKKIHIIAHSFGGRVAILLASSYNTLVDKMILCGSAGIKPRFNFKKRFKILWFKLLKKMGKKDLGKYGSNDYKGLSALMKQTFVKIVNTSIKNKCRDIICPTLLIYGERDKETPLYMAQAIKRRIVDSDIIIFKDSGHFAYLEQFDKFISITKHFLLKG